MGMSKAMYYPIEVKYMTIQSNNFLPISSSEMISPGSVFKEVGKAYELQCYPGSRGSVLTTKWFAPDGTEIKGGRKIYS